MLITYFELICKLTTKVAACYYQITHFISVEIVQN